MSSEIRIGFDKSRLQRETPLAYGVKLDGLNGLPEYGHNLTQFIVYLPKSQIKEWTEEGERIYCYVPAWLIEKNGIDFLVDTSNEPTLF